MKPDRNSKEYTVAANVLVFGVTVALVGALSDNVLASHLSQPTRALAVGLIVGTIVAFSLFVFTLCIRQNPNAESGAHADD
ncbi:hypothetical protein KOR42_55660 [Thalassoglobus neptunius]|uniref:Uncharacterized protein n=1 Tax=Thalassoglobus neptunius TaxID=1938619 RepID=A0A5C5UUW7_9PLAN|nr:hypothetical protein KOR42_55660 [Thalassoglobus neptunius]